MSVKADFAKSTDIAIIGGGMVGISLAILLAQKNPQWSISLIEAFPLNHNSEFLYQPSFDARSTALAAGSKNIFQQCGLWDQLQQYITPIKHVHVSDKGHFGGALIDAAKHQLPAVGYVIENAWLGHVLLAHCVQHKNIRCIAPATVKHIKPLSDGYCLQIDVNEQHLQLQAQLTIIADGADSAVCKQLGVGNLKKNYQQSAVIANIECDRPHHGVAYERFTADGPIALLPLGDIATSKKMSLVWTIPEDKVHDVMVADKQTFLQQLQQQFGFRQGQFIQVGERYQYPLQLIVAREQVRRGLVVMGNAKLLILLDWSLKEYWYKRPLLLII